MRRNDRHGRLAHPDHDRRRRPPDGFRVRHAVSFDRVVSDALADLLPAIARAVDAAAVAIVDIPPLGPDHRIRLVDVEVEERAVRRLTVYRRPAEQHAHGRNDLTDLVRDAIEAAVADALGIDPEA